MIFRIDESGLAGLVRQLLPQMADYRYVLLTGEMGAGKTTLVKRIAEALGAGAVAASPTFSVHNTYDGEIKILHSDLYRIESMEELEQTGFYELLDGADLALIEWADKLPVKDMLERYMEINILAEGGGRIYSLTLRG